MNNLLIYSDLHISQSSLKECVFILEEIGMLVNKYKVDTLINLGDTFDGLKPSSSEMDVFATFIRRIGKDKQHIILAANSHESESEEISVLTHYGILADNVKVVKEFKDGNHLYCGHFIVKEAKKNYGAKISKESLKDYCYVFLGHQHSYEVIKPNICQLGSVRYVNFDEANDKQKIVALIENYNTPNEKVHFLKLKSPYPMQQLYLQQKPILEGSNDTPEAEKTQQRGKESGFSSVFEGVSDLITYLDTLNANTKVKIKVKDFESYKQFLPLEWKYQQKFVKFVRENDFELISKNNQKSKQTEIDLKKSFEEFAREKQIDNEIKTIINNELKHD